MNRRIICSCCRWLLFPFLAVILVAGWTSFAYAEAEPPSLNVSGCENTQPCVDPIGKSDSLSVVLYDSKNGLPTSEVNAIVQTDDGFFWIGTYAGLIRYDGNAFESFASASGITNVRCLYVDSQDRLWVGTNDAGVFLMENGSFRQWGKEDGLGSDSIRAISQDTSGMIYVAGVDGVATIGEDMSLVRIEDDRIVGQTIREIRCGSDSLMYCVSETGDLYVLSEGKLVSHVRHEDYLSEGILNILPDPDHPGYLYAGTEHYLRHGSMEENVDSWEKWDVSPLQGLHNLECIGGNIWISARTGVGCFDGEKLSLLTDVPMDDSFCQIMTDGDGDIWIASERQGVVKIVPNQFAYLFDQYGIPAEVVGSTCIDDGRLYIGTENGLVVIEDGKVLDEVPVTRAATASDEPIEVSDLLEFLEGIRIRSIIKDSKDRLWIATVGTRGLIRYSDGEITQFTEEDGILSERLRVVSECQDSSILVATNDGINVIEGDRVVGQYGQEEGLVSRLILTITEGYNHEVIAGSDGSGIYVITQDGVRQISEEDGLPSDIVMRIRRSRSQDLYWIVTANHLCCMTPDYQVSVIQEFPSANNYDLYENSDGDLWLLGGTGIYVVPAESLLEGQSARTMHLGVANGLYYVPTANSFSELTQEGDLFIAGNEGVIEVNIEKPFEKNGTVKLALPYIDCDGNRFYPGADGEFDLPANARRITVFPYVLNYSLSDPRVSYRLDGFDLEDTTVSRSKLAPVNYTNLHGGRYSFVLEAGDKKISFVLDKEKTIFEQPLFWVAVALVLLLADVWLIRMILRRQARRIEMRKEQERIADELDMAREIQARSLPQTFPAFPDRTEFDLFASMTPAKEVGGDFYDFFMTDSDHLALVIADVSGKGIPAALFMMTSKTLIRNELMTGCDPATALKRVNLQLCERNYSSMFVTVWLAVLEISTGKGLACNAGHEHPGIRRVGGEFELLRYPHSMFVGGLKRAKYHNREFELRSGDCVFVYTDGVPEAANAAEDMFGEERLVEALNQNVDASPEELVQIVQETVNGFAGDAPQFDDITMLCCRMN